MYSAAGISCQYLLCCRNTHGHQCAPETCFEKGAPNISLAIKVGLDDAQTGTFTAITTQEVPHSGRDTLLTRATIRTWTVTTQTPSQRPPQGSSCRRWWCPSWRRHWERCQLPRALLQQSPTILGSTAWQKAGARLAPHPPSHHDSDTFYW